MAITVNIYYSGVNGNAVKFAEEMISGGIVTVYCDNFERKGGANL